MHSGLIVSQFAHEARTKDGKIVHLFWRWI